MSFIDPLLALQDVDAQIFELQREIKDIPAMKEQESAKVQEAKERLSAAQNELRALQAKAADFELQAQAAKDQVTKYRQQQMELKSNTEFKAMEKQITLTNAEAEKFEFEQLQIVDSIPEVEARVEEAKTKVADEESMIASYMEDLDARMAESDARVKELDAERHEIANGVSVQHLRVYERLVKRRRPAIVQLANGVCDGCHLTQPPAIYHLVQRDNTLVTCQMCGRILYK